jgi:uncharacterized membrane protein YkvA (DUF1232 family)
MKFSWKKPAKPASAKSGSESAASRARPDAAQPRVPPGSPPAPIRPEDYVGSDQARNEQVVREGFVAKAKRYLRKLPIAEEVVALYYCLLDPKTPVWVKGVVAAALAYFILPLDALPDILPLIGLSDDLTVLSTALAAISTHLTDEHRAKARAWLQHEHLFAAASDKPR